MTQKSAQKPDARTLRQFGLILGALLYVILGLLLPYFKSYATPHWVLYTALSLVGIALVYPKLLKFIYHPWLKLGDILGWINTRIILGIIYFTIFTPIALLFKIIKKDPMTRSFDPNASTYRIQSESVSIKHMENPY